MYIRNESISNKKCVIAISQSDYLVNSAGTEKFIREVESILNEENIIMLHIFPIRIKKNVYIGINIGGEYYGVCKKKNLEGCLYTIALERGVEYIGVHLHHIKGWDKCYLSTILERFNLPVIMFVHDVYMVCSKLSHKDGGLYRECSFHIQPPTKKNCKGCKYSSLGFTEYNETKKMLMDLSSKIVRVVFPSDVAKNNWLSVYGKENVGDVIVRPHMEYQLKKIDKVKNEKLKIAFLGVHSETKGYDVWNKLVSHLDLDKYELYCFSKRPSEQRCVHSVYVNFSDKNSKSMTEELKNNNIDIVFLWSIVQETFSYTYYEAIDAGCYVITNSRSGNIAAQVFKNNNGKVFENDQECIDWFKEIKNVKSCLDEFIISDRIPYDVKVNKSSKELLFDDNSRLHFSSDIKWDKKPNLLLGNVYYIMTTIRLWLIKGYNFLNKHIFRLDF